MDLKLHANATTTPRTRAYLQKSRATNAALARELGIHSRTVARWKARHEVTDRSTRPHRLNTSLTLWEEALVVELRRSLALPLDDIVEAVRRCLNPELSRSAIHRCLQRHGISARLTPDKAPAVAFHTDTPAGFIHIDVKYLPPLNRRRSYAYVAIDRATRFVYLESLPDRRADTAAGFLARFLERFQLTVHTVLTDNGSEFTDRFAVDKKGKPYDKPSGDHAFDRICARHSITHRLIRPFRPQTNGMVERFNRRLGEHLDRVPQNRAAHHRRFHDHAERDAYLHTFVADYNRTRLRCLDYQAPAELLAKLTGHNTKAGGADSRFIVTNLPGLPKTLYDKVYCARGQAENLIKAHKLHLASDRTSCTKATANQFRLLVHTAAYWLMLSLRGLAPRTSFWRDAQFDTIRLCLIKVAGRVTEMVTRIKIVLPTAFPYQAGFADLAGRIAKPPP